MSYPASLQILASWQKAAAPRWVGIARYYMHLDQKELALLALEPPFRSANQ